MPLSKTTSTLPTQAQISNRRFLTFLLGAIGIISLLYTFTTRSSHPQTPTGYSSTPIHTVQVDDDILKGGATMGKIGNETVKAELGRAAWKLLHTTMAKYPDKPTEDEQTALFSYIHLFARLYPCGECAGHFRQILDKFPPQVSTRSNAAAWACHVHNEVNKSLEKEIFDCANIGDFYDCGCADEDDKKKKKTTVDTGRIDVQVEKEGLMRGG